MTRKKSEQVLYRVKCARNPEHIFELLVEIKEGSGDQKSEIQGYCPYCDDFVNVEIQGKPELDEKVYREFQEQIKRMEEAG